jgi:hypothetical protein
MKTLELCCFVLICLYVLFTIGCWSAHPTKAQIVGKWKVEHNFGTETLTFSSNGTYLQRLVEKNGNVIENRNRWELQSSEEILSDTKVILHNAFIFWTPFGERETQQENQDWTLEAVTEWGRLILSFSPDLPGFIRE